MLAVAGVTTIDDKTAGVTVIVVVAVLPPTLPVTTELPAATPVTRPVVAPTCATVVVAKVKVVVFVRLAVLPLEYVPMMVSCCVAPTGIVGLTGAIAIDDSVIGVTVRLVAALMLPEVAEITLVPVLTPVASPLATTVAIAGEAEVKLEIAEMSREDPSV